MTREGARKLLPFSLASMTLYLFARIASIVDTKQSSKFGTAIGNFSGGYFTDKKHVFFAVRDRKAFAL